MGYLYIFLTIFFTVYGQITLKWRLASKPQASDDDLILKLKTVLFYFLDPWVISAFASAFIASLFWMMAVGKFQLSVAYPFMSLSFVLVSFLAWFLFQEPMTPGKIIGLVCIGIGVYVSSKY